MRYLTGLLVIPVLFVLDLLAPLLTLFWVPVFAPGCEWPYSWSFIKGLWLK